MPDRGPLYKDSLDCAAWKLVGAAGGNCKRWGGGGLSRCQQSRPTYALLAVYMRCLHCLLLNTHPTLVPPSHTDFPGGDCRCQPSRQAHPLLAAGCAWCGAGR